MDILISRPRGPGWLDELGSWTLLERLHKINNDDETPFQEVVHYITMTYYQ